MRMHTNRSVNEWIPIDQLYRSADRSDIAGDINYPCNSSLGQLGYQLMTVCIECIIGEMRVSIEKPH